MRFGTPVRLSGHLDAQTSRWLWLVKWVLVIPHLVVLAFLWLGVCVVWVWAFVAILMTGRYPDAAYAYVLGVLRWSWRVGFYGSSALATDQYPPFTLADVPSFPAHLDIAPPGRLHRGMPLVKWLFAFPHLVVVGVLSGGYQYAGWQDGHASSRSAGGLITLLAVIGAVVLAISGSYPKGLFDFVMGLNRWVWRVTAYVLLLTDDYPPFRLDPGADEPPVPALPSGPQDRTFPAAQQPSPGAVAPDPAHTPVHGEGMRS